MVTADPRVASTATACTTCWPSCRVRAGENPQPDRVQVAKPGEIRARRFQAVLLCGLQEGEFPRRAARSRSCPTTSAARSRGGGGLRLPLREDQLERERYLFYVCASRAERLLVLSSRYCDEEGSPEQPSFFLEDVRTCSRSCRSAAARSPTSPGSRSRRPRRPSGSGPRRPGARASCRACPAPADRAAPSWPSWPGGTRSRPARSRRFADCPVKWLVERPARPRLALEPDPEYMVRGLYAHEVLKLTYERLPRHGAAVTAGEPARGRAHPAGGDDRVPGRVPALAPADPGARGRAPARVRPAALPPPRGRQRLALRADALRVAVRRGSAGDGPHASAGGSTGWTSGTATRSCATTRPARAAWTATRWPAGGTSGASRPPSTCSPWSDELGLKLAGGVYTPLGGQQAAARGGSWRRSWPASSGPTSWTTTCCPRTSSRTS